MKMAKFVARLSGSLFVLLAASLAITTADPPPEEVDRAPSSYAPAKDLVGQVDFFINRIKRDLRDPAKFETRGAKRISKDANTLAVLALVLGKHDEQNKIKPAAVNLLQASVQLAQKTGDHESAKKAYAELLAASSSTADPAQLTWKSVGDIRELMEQVPVLDTKLRTALRPKRFAKSQGEAAGLAATLAAIAQVAMFDDSYCSDEADRDEWTELCALMRDAAYDIGEAVRQGYQEEAVAAMLPFKRTCTDCHDQFHK